MSSSQADGSRGRLVVISGPSGAGKTSICDAILEQLPNAVWSVSATTRPPRGNEAAGTSYEFVAHDEFMKRKAAGAFLESAEYCGHWYGTPAAPVRDAVNRGETVIMEIDVQGGVQIAQKVPESIRIFILPPDHESLKARLEGRNTESQAHMMRRLAAADGEIAIARDSGQYQYFVTNDMLDDTVARVIRTIQDHQA